MRATCDEGVCSSAAACLIIAAYMSAMHGELCEMSPAHAERISAQDKQKPRVGPVHEAGAKANRCVGIGCGGARHVPESGGAAAASCPEGFSGVCSAETDCKKRAASTAHSDVRRRRATVWRAMPCQAMPCHAMRELASGHHSVTVVPLLVATASAKRQGMSDQGRERVRIIRCGTRATVDGVRAVEHVQLHERNGFETGILAHHPRWLGGSGSRCVRETSPP
jgi:hypothetical protein